MSNAAGMGGAESAARSGRWLVICAAVAMSVGWGLRGFIGGGPLGAMIPGALIALVLCRGLTLPESACARIAAFGAIGIGFGGQETYGQTVRLVTDGGELFWRGLAGITLKGAVWGMVGGAVMGVALIARRVRSADLALALAALVIGTWAGWRAIDEPKVLYFSNLQDRPREEVWAGLLAGGVALLSVLAWRLRAGVRVPLVFAIAGLIGGGIGFGGGVASYAAGMHLGLDARWYPGWKHMEFTFGLCLGAALAFAAHWHRGDIAGEAPPAPAVDRSRWWPIGSVLLAVAILWVAGRLPLRFDFTVGGALLLALAWYSRAAAWQIAITVTVAAFTADVAGFFTTNYLPHRSELGWACAAAIAAVVAIGIARRERQGLPLASWAASVLLWTAIAAASIRTVLHPKITPALLITAAAFLVGGAIVALLWRKPVRFTP